MGLEDIKTDIEKAEELLRFLESIQIPDNVKKAAKEKWEASFDERMTLVANVAYKRADQDKDRQCAIRVIDAFNILRDVEEKMITNEVTGPVEVIADSFVSGYKLGFQLLQVLGQIIKAGNEVGWDAIWPIIQKLVTNFLIAASAAEVAKKLKSVFTVRDVAVAELRELALPQRTTTRHWREKRTREHS